MELQETKIVLFPVERQNYYAQQTTSIIVDLAAQTWTWYNLLKKKKLNLSNLS